MGSTVDYMRRPASVAERVAIWSCPRHSAHADAASRASHIFNYDSLTKRSPIIKELVDKKQLRIAAAMHDVTSGKVSWLS